jgi:hypothetical protein
MDQPPPGDGPDLERYLPRTGLAVTAQLDEAVYRKGQQVTSEDMSHLRSKYYDICSAWNYTLSPRE